jgi:hypothetical protein
MQAMLTDQHAEYDRNKTRGIPRPGKALLPGLVYCGACGHKMVVQYKGGTRLQPLSRPRCKPPSVPLATRCLTLADRGPVSGVAQSRAPLSH